MGISLALMRPADRWAVQGNRESIDGMAGGSAKVIQQVLKLVDGYDLYGRWAMSHLSACS